MLSVLYPRRCPLCGEIVSAQEGHGPARLAHPACLRKAPYIRKGCVLCGRALPAFWEKEVCGDCAQTCADGSRPHVFVRNYAVFGYEGAVKGALYGLKYKNKKEYAAFFAQEALRMYGAEWSFVPVEAVIPVPLHRKRKRARGYNQAACIAEPIAAALGVPCEERLARRVRNTAPLKTLNAGERYANLSGAFWADSRAGAYRCVLLVDDIYTTGSTLDALAGTLKETGVRHILCLTIAAGSPFI